jgi:trehalose utilization protein
VPQPDELIFCGWFEDGHVMRAGATLLTGAGKVFYFQPGHEVCPSYHNENVQRIITNAVRWAQPNEVGYTVPGECPHITWKTVDEFNK